MEFLCGSLQGLTRPCAPRLRQSESGLIGLKPGLPRRVAGFPLSATGRSSKLKRSGGEGGRKKGTKELPEVLYRFADATGKSATVIEDGVVSTITILDPPVIHPLSSFEERDYDPTSSTPMLPTTLLAPRLPRLPSMDEIPGSGPRPSTGVNTGTSGSNGAYAATPPANAVRSNNGKGASHSAAASVPPSVPSTTSGCPLGAGAASLPSPAVSSPSAAVHSSAATTSAVITTPGMAAPSASSSTTPLNSFASVDALTAGRTITIRRDPGPHPLLEVLQRIARWRPQFREWFRIILVNLDRGAPASRGLLLLPPKGAGGNTDGLVSSAEFDGSTVSDAAGSLMSATANRRVAAAATTSGSAEASGGRSSAVNELASAPVPSPSSNALHLEGETEAAEGGEYDNEGAEDDGEGEEDEAAEPHHHRRHHPREPLIDPLPLSLFALASAVAAVACLVALEASAAAAAAAAAAATAVPAPVPVDWVQLTPVAGVAPEMGIDWRHITWTELCNLVMEPLSRMFQKWSYAALPVKIAIVLASSTPLVMVFGALYYFAVGGRAAGQSLGDALIKIHCILNRMPGTNMVRESNALSFLVVNIAFFTGLFTFAIFLGIVSDEVKSTFKSIKTGTYPVRVRDHVLVINWSHHTIPLLRQYDLARQYAGNDAFFRRPVVLLSDNPKQDMDNEIAERLKSSSLEVITRSGSPAMIRDLATVAAARAHTVIVMHPGGAASHSAAEAAKASTAMALAALAAEEARSGTGDGGDGRLPYTWQSVSLGGLSGASTIGGYGGIPAGGGGGVGSAGAVRLPRVLFQMPDEVLAAQDPVTSFTRTSPANMSGNMQALSITDASVMDRFTCQAAVQPGMLRIWASVLQHGPYSVKALVVPVPPQLVGSTFATARCQYSDAVLIGLLRDVAAAAASGTAASNNSGGGGGGGVPFGLFGGGGSSNNNSSGSGGGSSSTVYGAGGAVAGSLTMGASDLDSRKLTATDQLVMFAPARVAGAPQPNPLTEALYPPASAAAAERIKRHGGYNAPPKKVIMAGYGWQDVPDVAAAFADSAPDGSQLTFILPEFPPEEPEDHLELPGSAGACRIKYVDGRGVMISLRALNEAGIKSADAVVLRPPIQDMERWCAKKPVTAKIREADAMVMAGLIQVQDAVIASGRTEPPHVVARLNRYGSTETALKYFELLSPPQPQKQPQPQPQPQSQSDAQQTAKAASQPQTAPAAAASAAGVPTKKDGQSPTSSQAAAAGGSKVGSSAYQKAPSSASSKDCAGLGGVSSSSQGLIEGGTSEFAETQNGEANRQGHHQWWQPWHIVWPPHSDDWGNADRLAIAEQQQEALQAPHAQHGQGKPQQSPPTQPLPITAGLGKQGMDQGPGGKGSAASDAAASASATGSASETPEVSRGQQEPWWLRPGWASRRSRGADLPVADGVNGLLASTPAATNPANAKIAGQQPEQKPQVQQQKQQKQKPKESPAAVASPVPEPAVSAELAAAAVPWRWGQWRHTTAVQPAAAAPAVAAPTAATAQASSSTVAAKNGASSVSAATPWKWGKRRTTVATLAAATDRSAATSEKDVPPTSMPWRWGERRIAPAATPAPAMSVALPQSQPPPAPSSKSQGSKGKDQTASHQAQAQQDPQQYQPHGVGTSSKTASTGSSSAGGAPTSFSSQSSNGAAAGAAAAAPAAALASASAASSSTVASTAEPAGRGFSISLPLPGLGIGGHIGGHTAAAAVDVASSSGGGGGGASATYSGAGAAAGAASTADAASTAGQPGSGTSGASTQGHSSQHQQQQQQSSRVGGGSGTAGSESTAPASSVAAATTTASQPGGGGSSGGGGGGNQGHHDNQHSKEFQKEQQRDKDKENHNHQQKDHYGENQRTQTSSSNGSQHNHQAQQQNNVQQYHQQQHQQQHHQHKPNLLQDGPLAAMQAVMMGSGLPALPIGNESTSPQMMAEGSSQGSGGGGNGGGGGGSTANAAAVQSSSSTAQGAATASTTAAATSGVAGGSGDSGGGGGGAGGGGSGGGSAASNPPASGAAGSGGAVSQPQGGNGNANGNGAGGSGAGATAGATGGGTAAGGSMAGPAGSANSGGSGTSGAGSGSTAASGGSGTSGTSSSSGSSGSSAGSTTSLYDKRPIIRNPEIFLADDLIGALLTQVAAQPNYTLLVSHLIKKDGVELYLRNPAVFNISPGERLTFAELSETTRLLRQVALGVVRADGRCCLVPKPHELLDFEAGDQVLVLSDDYRISRKK